MREVRSAAMPNLPLWYNTWSCLQKPFVRGLLIQLVGPEILFKFASIDTNWRSGMKPLRSRAAV